MTLKCEPASDLTEIVVIIQLVMAQVKTNNAITFAHVILSVVCSTTL